MPESGPKFLHRKYGKLSGSAEVQDALEFTQPDRPIPPTKPEERIQSYLDFLKGLVDRPKQEERERGIDAIKQTLYARHVIKSEEIPEAYFKSIEQRNRDEGRGDIKLPDEVRRELGSTLIDDQRKSLGRWIVHLASDEMRDTPDWIKYFVMRSVLSMGRYDKEKKSFTERTGGTTAPFPDLNHDALIVVIEDLQAKYGEKGNASVVSQPKIQFTGRYDIAQESKQKYLKFLEEKNFSKLYALTLEEYKPIPDELLRVTEGQWRTYPRGSDPKPLVDAIAPYGTGWCLRGEGMARQYLQGGAHFNANDLHVYYSNGKDGQPTIPRVVMVVNPNNQIDEMRGIWPGENIDPYIGGVVEAKLKEHPDGQKYKKKSADMQHLSEIYYKVYPEKDPRRVYQEPQLLTKEDLIFLYQINAPIEGFGLNDQEDPRIAELRAKRNPKEDAPIVFECALNEIAWSKDEVNNDTKAYVGPLFPGVFEALGNLEHIYTSFPEGKIRREQIVIGGSDVPQLEAEFKRAGMKIGDYALAMMKHKDFTTLKNPEQADLVRLKVRDLGFAQGATTQDIYDKAQEFGLELCPAEVGPHYRLTNMKQAMGEWTLIAMKQITVPGGPPSIFCVGRNEGGAWLSYSWAGPDSRWSPDYELVFRLRKSKT